MKYYNLLLMSILSFLSMYILMYIMVDQYANVYSNFNQLYMAGIMTIPMIFIELWLMGSMYTNKMLNFLIILFNCIALIVFMIGIRKQIAIDDIQFLKSMIPHHAAALLMCKEAQLHDSEIIKLCKNITASQQSEIDFMKLKLEMIKKSL